MFVLKSSSSIFLLFSPKAASTSVGHVRACIAQKPTNKSAYKLKFCNVSLDT